MQKKQNPMKSPPSKPIKSLQYDLFSQFITNEQSNVSNAIEVWESIPKYFFTPDKVKKLRTSSGHANPYKWDYQYNGIDCTVKVQPALVEQDDGHYEAFFPGVTEELVEEALKKILTDQHNGSHDPHNLETWVYFTLSMVQKELTERERSRNRNQIKQAVEVMSSCIITLYKEGKEIWKGSILQDLTTVGRDEYLADTNARHVARLPLFISHAINQLEYRQFNYKRFLNCSSQLSRWIYRQLIHRFRQASFMNSYHFMYSDLKRDSGLLQQDREHDNRKKVTSAFDELVSCGVLQRCDEDVRKEGRKIVDVKYTSFPTPDFVAEQKAANKRAHDASVVLKPNRRR